MDRGKTLLTSFFAGTRFSKAPQQMLLSFAEAEPRSDAPLTASQSQPCVGTLPGWWRGHLAGGAPVVLWDTVPAQGSSCTWLQPCFSNTTFRTNTVLLLNQGDGAAAQKPPTNCLRAQLSLLPRWHFSDTIPDVLPHCMLTELVILRSLKRNFSELCSDCKLPVSSTVLSTARTRSKSSSGGTGSREFVVCHSSQMNQPRYLNFSFKKIPY